MSSDAPQPLRYAIAGLLGMVAAMGIGRFVFTPILPTMMEGLGLSAADAGTIAAANYLGYLAGAVLAAGGWAQGRERVLAVVALAANALLLLMMGVADSLWAFVAVRFVAGVASAFTMVFMTAIVFSRLAVAGRGGLQAFHFAGVGSGIALSALITGAMFLAGADWRAAWLVSGAVAVAAFLVVLALMRGGPLHGDGAAAAARPEPPMPWSPALARIVVSYGVFGLGYIVTATFLVAIVREGQGGPLFESLVWLATGLTAAPSVWLWGKLVARIGLSVTIAVGCVVEAVGVVASVALPPPLGPLLGAIFLGGTFVAITAYGLQAGRQLAVASPRRTLAIMTAVFGVGQIIGPLVAGYVADWTGSFTAASFGAALALLASGWFAWSSGAGGALGKGRRGR